MPVNEGETLRNKLRGTGKTMPEIAKLLGMTRQNLNYHLRKDILEDDFKRLLSEKGKYIFHVEQLENVSYGNTLSELAKAIVQQATAILQHAETINSQQYVIRRYIEKEPDIGKSKNGLPSQKTKTMKRVE